MKKCPICETKGFNWYFINLLGVWTIRRCGKCDGVGWIEEATNGR